MPAIIGSFEYSGTDYLDKRVSFSSLTALETQTDIKFPNVGANQNKLGINFQQLILMI